MNTHYSILEGLSIAIDLARGRHVHRSTGECVSKCLDLAAKASRCDSYQSTRCVCVSPEFEISARTCLQRQCSTSEMYGGLSLVASMCGSSPAPMKPTVSLAPRQDPVPDPNFTSGFASLTSLRSDPTQRSSSSLASATPFPPVSSSSPTSSSDILPPATSFPDTPQALSGKSNIGPIVGGVVGGIAALVLIVIAIFLMRRRRKRSQLEAELDLFDPSPAETPHIPIKKGDNVPIPAMHQLPRGQHLTAPSSSDQPSNGFGTSGSEISPVPSSYQPPSSDGGISQVPTSVLFHELRQRMRLEQEESVFSGPPDYMTTA